jgi:hypothetical protein
MRWLVAHQGWVLLPDLAAARTLDAPRGDPPRDQSSQNPASLGRDQLRHHAAQGVPYTRTSLWQSYRIVIGYLNTVGLRGKDPFLCPLVAQRRAL